MSTRVTKKSTAMTATDAATTALVVDRPTPWVPPVVRRPTWQPIVTITNPRQNGLISPIQASSRYSPLRIDDQYTLDTTRSWNTATSQPPTMPTPSEITVNTGAMMNPASTRGTTSFLMGSVPRARSALI